MPSCVSEIRCFYLSLSLKGAVETLKISRLLYEKKNKTHTGETTSSSRGYGDGRGRFDCTAERRHGCVLVTPREWFSKRKYLYRTPMQPCSETAAEVNKTLVVCISISYTPGTGALRWTVSCPKQNVQNKACGFVRVPSV